MTGSAAPIQVLVLSGGPDAEHEVSRRSAQAVLEALAATPGCATTEICFPRSGDCDRAAIVDASPDVIFPVLHGPWGEGGPLQEILEATGIPFVGSDARASALAMDKHATKELAEQIGLRTPRWQVLEAGVPCDIVPPLVFKPVSEGSSIGMYMCQTHADVKAAMAEVSCSPVPMIAEAYIAGREVTVGILGHTALPLVEIIPAGTFYDYEAKYDRDDTRYIVDPLLPDGASEACQADAVRLFEAIGARDLARVDFIIDEQGPWFLEVNTAPGFTSVSLLPMAAAASCPAHDMTGLCRALLVEALGRGAPP